MAVTQTVLLTALAAIYAAPALAQPCNPAIDGTYCASETRSSSGNARVGTGSNTRQTFGSDFSSLRDNQPATLGAITFRGDGTRCMGLLHRGGCN